MKSFIKIGFIVALIGLVGFTIATNENSSSIEPVLNNEFAPVEEQVQTNTSIVEYINLGTMRASWYGLLLMVKLTTRWHLLQLISL